ncbi:hypothetical protein Barb4_04717 [Bacteroidales bacterium Barb4]|nr:hypothetical protein Barb4_04717 [Bacteroidales bacterium Barb4]
MIPTGEFWKNDTNTDNIYNATYIIRSFFQNFLVFLLPNPTFRFAACGAEISCPFRASA